MSSAVATPKWSRVVVKLSGEALQGSSAYGLDAATLARIASDLAAASAAGHQIAVVVGGGFIGLEMVENLLHRGLAVTVLEKLPQVMPPLDPEVAAPLMNHLRAKGVQLHLGDGLASIEATGTGLVVVAESGARLDADIVVLAIGVKPENGLARAAGLEIGAKGGIVVDPAMRTSDPSIWAVGDVVEVNTPSGGKAYEITGVKFK